MGSHNEQILTTRDLGRETEGEDLFQFSTRLKISRKTYARKNSTEYSSTRLIQRYTRDRDIIKSSNGLFLSRTRPSGVSNVIESFARQGSEEKRAERQTQRDNPRGYPPVIQNAYSPLPGVTSCLPPALFQADRDIATIPPLRSPTRRPVPPSSLITTMLGILFLSLSHSSASASVRLRSQGCNQ